jgi:hypothetical protein
MPQTIPQVKSVKLGATMYRIKSVIAPARISQKLNPENLESNLTLDWLDRIMTEVEHFTGDDWLSLCPDIDQGEIYRDWLIYHDAEISQLWEAYDYQGDRFFTAGDLVSLKQKIDRIENIRAAHPLIFEKFTA